jgi:integrase
LLVIAALECQDSAVVADDNASTLTEYFGMSLNLTAHAAEWAGAERFFISRDGSPMRGNAVYQAFVRARTKVGLTGLSFHDLRHTGQTLAAATGATLADLKLRLGHSSAAAAALRYLHAVEGRDREVAEALSRLAAGGDAVSLPRKLGS